MDPLVPTDPWQGLRAHTTARIALGRTGASLPTARWLELGQAHAQAKDAIGFALDSARLAADLEDPTALLEVHSRAADRAAYLLRPDLGRRLDERSARRLSAWPERGFDLVLVLADGLSPAAIQFHAPALLRQFRPLLPSTWRLGPLVLARQSRVALGDEIGALLEAKLVAVLIGERPGMSSPDSLGIYLTSAPKVGTTDALRNCISNIRPQGLKPDAGAQRLAWLCRAASARGLTGIELKDDSQLLAAP